MNQIESSIPKECFQVLQPAKEVTCPILALPSEMLLHIFSLLASNPFQMSRDARQIALVCRPFRACIHTLYCDKLNHFLLKKAVRAAGLKLFSSKEELSPLPLKIKKLALTEPLLLPSQAYAHLDLQLPQLTQLHLTLDSAQLENAIIEQPLFTELDLGAAIDILAKNVDLLQLKEEEAKWQTRLIEKIISFKQLQSLTLSIPLTAQEIALLLKNSGHLKELHLDCQGKGKWEQIAPHLSVFTCLKKLSLRGILGLRQWLHLPEDHPLCKLLAQLQSLSIDGGDHLIIGDEDVSGFIELLQRMSQLRELHLSIELFTGSYAPAILQQGLKENPYLTALSYHISNFTFKDLLGIESLTQLKKLHLSQEDKEWGELSDAEMAFLLKNKPYLQELSLDFATLTGQCLIDGLAKNCRLKKLSIGHFKDLSSEHLRLILKDQPLRYLHVYDSRCNLNEERYFASKSELDEYLAALS